MFLVLLGLFFYVFASSSVTILHRIYLSLHIVFMIWPLCQFISATVSTEQYRLFYLSIAYSGLSLLGIGWFVFVIFLTGQSYVIHKTRLILLAVPALISVSLVVFNPNQLFLKVNNDAVSIQQLQHGPLYWYMIGQILVYGVVSFVILLSKLKTVQSTRHRTLIRTGIFGMLVLLIFAIIDLFVNVVFVKYINHFIPLISIGMMFAAVYNVHAIGRHKVFDLIQLVQRDIMNTMSMGIVVLDEYDTVIEVNKAMRPFFRLRSGDKFNLDAFTYQLKGEQAKEFESMLKHINKRPNERIEMEITLNSDEFKHIIVQSAPIMNMKKVTIGRVFTFQDMTELRMLLEETSSQNELLQLRNEELLQTQDELYQANKKLEHMAITDGLTGCYNRRYLLQQLEHEVVANIRYGIPFSFFLFDLDYFKSINDTYGHLVGDEVLCSTIDAVRGALRLTDIIARYGGEEFTIYLPHTNREQAVVIAEMVKEAVENNVINTGSSNQNISVTISMGVVSYENFEPAILEEPKQFLRNLLAEADAALYEAKYNGRNQIVRRKLA